VLHLRQRIRRLYKKDERGAAILLAVFSLAMMIFIAVQVSYDTQVEYVAAVQSVNRLKAYYAAKSGVEISLLRISLYKKAMAGLGGTLGDSAQQMLDPIWQMPFSWPPLTPDDLNAVDKDQIATTVKESLMDAQYFTTIEGEGGKIDVNDLASPSEEYAKKIRAQLLQIFTVEKENNEKFEEEYGNYDFEELLNNIADWVDDDKDGRNNRGESELYQDRELEDSELPPNQPFKTLEELHMVAGMDDALFNLLRTKVTVYGTKGINVNTASPDLLKALDAQITDEVLAEIMKRRNDPNEGGPFKNEEDFFGFLRSKGVRTDKLAELDMPLLFDAEFNFRIVSSGKVGNTRREITAITFDIDNLTDKMVQILNDAAKNNPTGTPTPTPSPTTSPTGGNTAKKTYKAPKGAPTVVYWQEL
jgi:general secretion pathway protein K